jgi:hypothetical protein
MWNRPFLKAYFKNQSACFALQRMGGNTPVPKAADVWTAPRETDAEEGRFAAPQVSTFVSADPDRRDDVTGDHGMISSKELSIVGQAFQPVTGVSTFAA